MAHLQNSVFKFSKKTYKTRFPDWDFVSDGLSVGFCSWVNSQPKPTGNPSTTEMGFPWFLLKQKRKFMRVIQKSRVFAKRRHVFTEWCWDPMVIGGYGRYMMAQHVPIIYLSCTLTYTPKMQKTCLFCSFIRKAQNFVVSLHNFFGDNINGKHTRPYYLLLT